MEWKFDLVYLLLPFIFLAIMGLLSLTKYKRIPQIGDKVEAGGCVGTITDITGGCVGTITDMVIVTGTYYYSDSQSEPWTFAYKKQDFEQCRFNKKYKEWDASRLETVEI